MGRPIVAAISSLNSSTLIARPNMDQGSQRLHRAMESLSIGLKSNLSREDPAAFLRGSQMAAHVRWQTEAVQNISNAGAMAGVADTGIEQVSDALLRIRELAK